MAWKFDYETDLPNCFYVERIERENGSVFDLWGVRGESKLTQRKKGEKEREREVQFTLFFTFQICCSNMSSPSTSEFHSSRYVSFQSSFSFLFSLLYSYSFIYVDVIVSFYFILHCYCYTCTLLNKHYHFHSPHTCSPAHICTTHFLSISTWSIYKFFWEIYLGNVYLLV